MTERDPRPADVLASRASQPVHTTEDDESACARVLSFLNALHPRHHDEGQPPNNAA